MRSYPVRSLLAVCLGLSLALGCNLLLAASTAPEEKPAGPPLEHIEIKTALDLRSGQTVALDGLETANSSSGARTLLFGLVRTEIMRKETAAKTLTNR